MGAHALRRRGTARGRKDRCWLPTLLAVKRDIALEQAGLPEPREVVLRELAADPEPLGHLCGAELGMLLDDPKHAPPQIPVGPVLQEDLGPLGVRARASDEVSDPTVDLPNSDDSPIDQDAEVVPGGSLAEAQGSDDRSEVIPRETEQVIVDSASRRVVERGDLLPEHEEDKEPQEGAGPTGLARRRKRELAPRQLGNRDSRCQGCPGTQALSRSSLPHAGRFMARRTIYRLPPGCVREWTPGVPGTRPTPREQGSKHESKKPRAGVYKYGSGRCRETAMHGTSPASLGSTPRSGHDVEEGGGLP